MRKIGNVRKNMKENERCKGKRTENMQFRTFFSLFGTTETFYAVYQNENFYREKA